MSVQNTFHAPVNHSIVAQLVAQYRDKENKINTLAETVKDSDFSVFHYFNKGNFEKSNNNISNIYIDPYVLFNTQGALKQLKSEFWEKIMEITNVWKIMPAIRRKEWKEQIQNNTTPDFTEDNVRATILSLFNSSRKFIAEKIDGVFSNLSDVHATNCPERFGKRFIMQAYDKTGLKDSTKMEYINDLRSVISHFLNRGEFERGTTAKILDYCYNDKSSEWVHVDGNTLKVRAYKKGTIHFEVHQDIADQLNDLLAELYPLSIPLKNKKINKNKIEKEYTVHHTSLPYTVVNLLSDMKKPPLKKNMRYMDNHYWTDNENSLKFSQSNIDWKSPAVKQAIEVLESIGGSMKVINNAKWFEFDYEPELTIKEIVVSGSVPEQKSHQFYPTQEPLALEAIEISDIQDNDLCLEPNAGQGGLLKYMPKNTVAVEISTIYSQILKDKGYNVINDDFIHFAKTTKLRFDKIVMNPPFSEGRAILHTQTAFSLLKDKGDLTAILPATYKDKIIIDGKIHKWSDIKNDCFAGTKVSVVIVKIFN